ncbi:MAG: sce7726 family protein [Lachnospiraceae bacterium]|nr:sce7726 family protein [Lachnospiraceae bacterium]MCI9622890.1 sce7726 family protein [Lachnospiraceae bacterium]
MLYDKDIREPLFDYLEERYGKARMIEEKQMGRSRADIVMVLPGELAGIEIKSDADTYARLKRQVKDYDRFFDRNYVVAGSTHAMHIGEHVPEYWGIISVEQMEEGVDFYMIREAARNPKMELELKLRILWRPELAHIQAICGMAKYGGKSKEFVRNKIAEGVPAEILNELISEELFERDYTEIRREIEEFRGRRKK